jgi:divalent metal cation (Fe/Co/Zn/Cd) transporter
LGRAVKLEYLSTAWMAIEVAASVAAGILAGSLALLAFGGDSLIELISGGVVLAQLKGDGGPETSEKVERIAGGLLIALVPTIALGSVYSYFAGLRPEGSPLGIAVALAASIIMPFLYFEKRRIGERTATASLRIDAIESLTCFFMSIALVVGLLVEYLFGLWWADYLATAAILVFVGKEAIESFRELHAVEGRSEAIMKN